jgi:hypothetical protein
MLQVFYLDVVYVCNIFLTVFASVLETYFKGFICLFLYVTSVAYECFKSRSRVAYKMHVGSQGVRAPVAQATFGGANLKWSRDASSASNVRPARAHAWTQENRQQPWASIQTSGADSIFKSQNFILFLAPSPLSNSMNIEMALL